MAKETFSIEFAGRTLTVETGQVAKQANGAVVVRYGDTTVLTAATMGKMATGDFFPLQVNYEEKMYAAGKFPGGFNKREARPSTDATLTARLIDRPIRPMFHLIDQLQVLKLPILMENISSIQLLRKKRHQVWSSLLREISTQSIWLNLGPRNFQKK